MNKTSKLKERLIDELQTEIDALNTVLKTKNEELKELKATPDSVIDRLKDKLKTSEPQPAEPGKGKRKKTTRPRLSPEQTQALKDGLVDVLKKHGDWMKAAELKTAFNKLPNAGSRYNTIVSQLKADKVIISRGELTKTEYKLK